VHTIYIILLLKINMAFLDIGKMSPTQLDSFRAKGALWDLTSSPNDPIIKKAKKLLDFGVSNMGSQRVVDAQNFLKRALDILRAEPFDSLQTDDPERLVVDALISRSTSALVDCMVLRMQFEAAHAEALKCDTVQEELHPICTLFACRELYNSCDDLEKTKCALHNCVKFMNHYHNLEVRNILRPQVVEMVKSFRENHEAFFMQPFRQDCYSPTPLSISALTTEKAEAEAAADAMTKEFEAELAAEYNLAVVVASTSTTKYKKPPSRRRAKAKKISAQKDVKNEPSSPISTADICYYDAWHMEPPSTPGSDGFTDDECASDGSRSLQDQCLPSTDSLDNDITGYMDYTCNEDASYGRSIITLSSLEPHQHEGSPKSTFDLHAALVRSMKQKQAVAPFSKFNQWRRTQTSKLWAEWTDSDGE